MQVLISKRVYNNMSTFCFANIKLTRGSERRARIGGRSEFNVDENGSLALYKEILSGPFESNLTSFILVNGDSH